MLLGEELGLFVSEGKNKQERFFEGNDLLRGQSKNWGLVKLAFDQVTQFMTAGSQRLDAFIIRAPNLIPIRVVKPIYAISGISTSSSG